MSGKLEADILASDIAVADRADVTVRNQGGENDDDTEISNKVSFSVNNPAPAISSISPYPCQPEVRISH